MHEYRDASKDRYNLSDNMLLLMERKKGMPVHKFDQ